MGHGNNVEYHLKQHHTFLELPNKSKLVMISSLWANHLIETHSDVYLKMGEFGFVAIAEWDRISRIIDITESSENDIKISVDIPSCIISLPSDDIDNMNENEVDWIYSIDPLLMPTSQFYYDGSLRYSIILSWIDFNNSELEFLLKCKFPKSNLLKFHFHD